MTGVFPDSSGGDTEFRLKTTQTTIKLTKNDHEILQVIQNNPALSQKEIAMELGWTVDRVKYYLNKMKKQEAIRRIGSSHKGYWELLIKL